MVSLAACGKRWLWVVTGIAAIFRFPSLFANSFLADEALFASYARLIAVWRDPLLQTQLVDKPPLLFYLQAIFYPMLGPVEWAARFPNFIASLLLVPLVGVWAWRLYEDEKTAVFAAIFIALSPLAIQFSATAFTDPLLTTFLTASLMAMGDGRQAAGGRSGILFGLAALTKYQAWLFLPLLAGIAWLGGWRGRDWRRWLAGFAPVMGALPLWEWVRTGELQLWSAQVVNFGGIRPIWSWELWSRARNWASLWGQTMGSVWLAGLAAALLILAGIGLWRRRDRRAELTWLLLLFVAGYILLHWLLAVPVWDRYLLPLLPVMAVVIGKQFSIFSHQYSVFRNQYSVFGAQLSVLGVVALVLFLLLLPGAWEGRNGRFPMGGQLGADQGAAVVAQALADAPYGAVLYDHWFSWQWRYLLFDRRVFVSWFPHPNALAEELSVFGDDGAPHFLALPDSAVARPVKRAVAGAGFRLQPVPLEGTTQIELYEIVPTGKAFP